MKALISTGKLAIFGTVLLLLVGAWSSPAQAASRYDWFWFLYEDYPDSIYPSKLITPFYFTSRDIDTTYTASLPPFIFWKYESKGSIKRNWLLGLGGDVDYTHSNGVKDYDFGMMPFVLYGSSPDKRDKYLFVWPIGGQLRGKLALDYINSWVFPGVLLFIFNPMHVSIFPMHNIIWFPVYVIASFIPVYEQYGRGDYSAQAILWPLIQWGGSPTRSEFRILPFYAHNYKKDYYDNYSWLMIINYTKTFYKKGRELTTFMTFPFFTRRWMNDHALEASSLFWPFFSWGYNKRQGNIEINFPWPIFIYQKSEQPRIRKLIFFPFYGNIEYENDQTKFITPLYFNLKRDNETFKSDYYIICLLGWYFTRDYKKHESPYYGTKWSYLKVWPLFRYESNDKGDVHFNALSILPFRDPAGYEKIYDPLWSLVEYHNEKGLKRFGLLLRTYYQCWDDRNFKSRIPILFSYESVDGRVKEFLILLSMFGYQRDKDGTYIRLVWIPIRVGDGVDFESSAILDEKPYRPETVPQYLSVDRTDRDFIFGRMTF